MATNLPQNTLFSSVETFLTNTNIFFFSLYHFSRVLRPLSFQKRASPGDSRWRMGRFRGKPAWSQAGGLLPTREAPGFRSPLRYVHAVAPWGGRQESNYGRSRSVFELVKSVLSSFFFFFSFCFTLSSAGCLNRQSASNYASPDETFKSDLLSVL